MSRFNELTAVVAKFEPFAVTADSPLPPAASYPGSIVYTQTNTSPGVPALAFSNGTNWFPITVSATPIS